MIKSLRANQNATCVLILLGICAAYMSWTYAHLIYSPLHISSASIRLCCRFAIASVPIALNLLCLHKPSDMLKSLGLKASIARGLAFAAACSLPLFIGFSIIGDFDHNISYDIFIRKIILAAFFEEVVFRGFMFGQLFRYGRIGFVWSAILPAVLFGIGHLYQGHSAATSLMAFGVTALGSLYFSWVYTECNFNLWVPVGLHIFMNFCWIALPAEGNYTAVGALIPNILRLSSIAISIIAITIYKKRKQRSIFDHPIVTI